MNWPIGMGQKLFGIIDRESKTIEPFRDEENLLHLNEDYELEENHEIKMIVLLNKQLKK